MPKEFKIPIDQLRVNVEAVKTRQKERMKTGKPQNISLNNIYQMLFDVLENQAQLENKINQLLK